MHLAEDRWGHRNAIVCYDTREEEMAAIKAFLRGDYGALTSEEIGFFEACRDDPDGVKDDARHAGEIRCDQDWLNMMIFVCLPTQWSQRKCLDVIRRYVGPHPIDEVAVLIAVPQIVSDWNKEIERVEVWS